MAEQQNETQAACEAFLREPATVQFLGMFKNPAPVRDALAAAFATGALYATQRCEGAHHGEARHG